MFKRQKVNTDHKFQHTDVFIVEYPKSGITWFSHILANCIVNKNGLDLDINQVSQRFFIQDLHICRNISSKEYQYPVNRFFKTHHYDEKMMKNVIYLVRHPVDVMQSYLRYRSLHLGYSIDQEDFIFGNRFGKKSHLEMWKKHVRKFIHSNSKGAPRFILRYEDLKSQPVDTINQLNKLFGWKFSEDSIRAAITSSSMENMKEFDTFYRERLIAKNRIKFVGATGLKINDEMKSKIIEFTQKECNELGYLN